MGDDKSIHINGNNQGIAISGDGNTVYLSTTKPKTLEESLTQWQSKTNVTLSPNLVLKSRENETQQLLDLLSKPLSKIIIVSSSEQESYAFIICSLKNNPKYSDKVRVVRSQENWDTIIKNKESLILIYQEFTPNNIGVAIAQGHFVVEAEESTNIQDKSHDIIQLSKIKKSYQVATLKEMGLNHDDAWELYSDTKGFLYAMIQHPLLKPMERIKPEWVSKYSMDILSTILFINSWNRINKADTKIVEKLSNISYEEFEKELFSLKEEKNPPIRLVGNVWQVISKINLWDLVADNISTTQIDNLKPIVLEIFTEIDPVYEVPPKDRWYAHNLDNMSMQYSGLIRESLADTLVLLSVFGERKLTYPSAIKAVIDNWLQELFESNLNVEAWYSYYRPLLLLAEASPNSFLTALEKSLNNILITRMEELFEDAGDMGGCFHCNLLWSLESISWNLEYLSRVVLLLARLSEIEIKSSMGNQPFNSLREVLIGAFPHCSATHKEQIQIIEHILLKKYPNTTWKLLLKILPDNVWSSPIHKPKYQDWDETISDDVLQKDYNSYCVEINRLLFENVENDLQHWYDVFNNIEKFYEKYFFETIDKFITLDKSLFSDEIRLTISNILRAKIHKHRLHPDTYWAMEKKFVDKLEEAFLFIEPDSLIDKYQYLFNMGSVDILNPIPYDENISTENFKKEDKVVETLRNQAILEIIEKENFKNLVTLIKRTNYSGTIGRGVFLTTGDKYYQVMIEWLESDDNHLYVCAKNYISQYIQANLFNETMLEGLTDKQKSEIILAFSFKSKTFEILKKQDAIVQQLYWKNIDWYYRLEKKDKSYINWIIEQFYTNKFVDKALNFISSNLHSEIDINMLFRILYEMNPNDESIDRYDISQIIEFLQKSKLTDEEIRFLEWKYLMLQSFNPIHWEKLIITNPKAFTELVSWIYKPKNPRDEDTDLTQEQIDMRHANAKELLHRFQLFREYDDIEPMDKEKLRGWVVEAKENFKELDRVKIGDDRLGVFLAKTSKEEDGVFPNKMVCEIIEEFGNDAFERGFIHEVIYPNGTRSTQKAYDSGGEQEHEESAQYQKYADVIRFIYPKTSKLLKKISNWYLREANYEDMKNEL